MKKLLASLVILSILCSTNTFCGKKKKKLENQENTQETPKKESTPLDQETKLRKEMTDWVNERITDFGPQLKKLEEEVIKKNPKIVEDTPDLLRRYVYCNGFTDKTRENIISSMLWLLKTTKKKGLIPVEDLLEKLNEKIAPTVIKKAVKMWSKTLKTNRITITNKTETNSFQNESIEFFKTETKGKDYLSKEKALHLILKSIALFMHTYLSGHNEDATQTN